MLADIRTAFAYNRGMKTLLKKMLKNCGPEDINRAGHIASVKQLCDSIDVQLSCLNDSELTMDNFLKENSDE